MENNGTKLREQVILAVKSSLKRQKIGIAFSGGVDSSLLAKICHDLGCDITLLTVGFANSHDLEFSRKIADMLKLRRVAFEIPDSSFRKVAKEIRAQIGTDNLSWNENCIAFYFVSKIAREISIDVVLTSNGIDELFCGYNAYRQVIGEGKDAVLGLMDTKLKNETEMMKAVNKVSSEFGVSILQPFLSEKFVTFAKSLPLEVKIKGEDDMMRKHAIRDLALLVGVPSESALKRKKALQYGSLIHKNLMKFRKT